MKNILLGLGVGLLVGIGGTLAAWSWSADDAASQATDHSTMSMAEMNRELKDLRGDNYDKAFIEMMIAHHEGALDMAKLTDDRTDRTELLQLSDEIITAQEQEIAQMRQWQLDWQFDPEEVQRDMHRH